MRWLLPAVVCLVGCRVPLTDRAAAPLPVTEVSVTFRSAEEGQLAFAFDLPEGAGEVASVWWDVSLNGARFATGVEGVPTLTARPAGGWRVTVTSPLVLRHLDFREGATFLRVLVRGEVLLKRRGVDERRPFTGTREVLATGAPVTRERLAE